jgi:phospholipid/cholesterol/gamma-HCH transport system substrate-binding protein
MKLQHIADTASVFIANLRQEESNPNTPVGILLHDKESGASLKETIKNLESSSEKLNEDLKAAQNSFLLRGYFKKKTKAGTSDSVK